MHVNKGLTKENFRPLCGLLRSRSASHSKRKALVIKCEKESKSEGHKPKKVVTADDFSLLVAGAGLEPATFGL